MSELASESASTVSFTHRHAERQRGGRMSQLASESASTVLVAHGHAERSEVGT